MSDAKSNGSQPQSISNGNGSAVPNVPGRQMLDLNQQQRQYLWEMAQAQLEQHHEMVTNLATISRQWLANQSDSRRNLNDECGYPVNPSVDLYRTLYDREPVAARVVELMPKECWQATPTVFEDMDSTNVTPFEEAWDTLGQMSRGEISWHQDEQGSMIWEKLQRVDIISGIGSFGVLLLGIDDGKNLQDPIDGVMTVNNSRRERLHDGPLTLDEEKALRNPQPRWLADDTQDQGACKGVPTQADRLGASPLNNAEQLILNSWVQEREREWTLNAHGGYERRDAKRDRGFHVPGKEISATRASPINPARGDPLADMPYPGVFGTDRQYDAGWGGQPESLSVAEHLSGTDAQYFGVQFGGSEFPAGTGVGDVGGRADEEQEQRRASADVEGKQRPRPRLLFLRPFGEDLVQIVRYEWNMRNPRFGMPVMYRVTLNNPRSMHSGVGLPLATVFVHWSRIVHVADNTRDSEIFGMPRLQQVLNPVLDVQKIRGAGAEGYWKSAFTGLQFVTHPQLGGDVFLDEASLKDSAENFQNSLQRIMTSKGGSWQTIAPSVTDPTPHINVNIEAICIALACPVPVFKGYEIGEQASTNNAVEWNKRKYERQNNYLTPKVIVPLVDRLILIGVLPAPGGAKEKVDKIKKQQPTANVRRVQGGWLVTNWRRPVKPIRNANPEGHNQYTGKTEIEVKKLKARRSKLHKEVLDGVESYEDAYLSPTAKREMIASTEKTHRQHVDALAFGTVDEALKAGRLLASHYRKMLYDEPTGNAEGHGGSSQARTSGDRDNELDRGAEPWETGQSSAGTMTGQGKPSTVFVAEGGYSIEWPDVEALSKAAKAGIAVQFTTALAAYIQGGCEAVMPVKDYLINVWGWSEEQAADMVEAAKMLHEENTEDDPLTMPRMEDGRPLPDPNAPTPKEEMEMKSKQFEEMTKMKSDQFAAKTSLEQGKMGVDGLGKTKGQGSGSAKPKPSMTSEDMKE